MQCLDVLQDIGSLGRDEDHVQQLFKGLVDVAHCLGLDCGVLCARVDEAREGGQKNFDLRLGHGSELAREDR